jgi:hypothetical protein
MYSEYKRFWLFLLLLFFLLGIERQRHGLDRHNRYYCGCYRHNNSRYEHW